MQHTNTREEAAYATRIHSPELSIENPPSIGFDLSSGVDNHPAFAALERPDWKGVMDLDPQAEPLIPEKVAERDWYDLASDAQRSCRNAMRCDRHGDRSINLLAAREQIDIALRLLHGGHNA